LSQNILLIHNVKHSTPEIGGDAGKEVEFGGPGYKYFGAARELPGVKDLFHQPGTFL